MIKLVISSHSSSATHCFDQPSITIGSAQDVDLPLSDLGLQPHHISITMQQEGSRFYYIATNLANDPFASINDLPFGKQQVHSGDTLEIAGTKIQMEFEVNDDAIVHEKQGIEPPSSEIDFLLQQVEALSNHKEEPVNDYNKEKNVLPSIDETPLSLPSLTEPIPSPSVVIAPPTNPTSTSTPKISLKDYYLSEYDDEEDSKFPIRERPSAQWQAPPLLSTAKYWYRIIKTFLYTSLAILVIFGTAYAWLKEQTNEEELRAAKGMADVAMALTHAHLKNIRPKNQNWTDPDFIRKNITAVLPSAEEPFIEFDGHGQLISPSYFLRIYTSHDLSQFLVIAQPTPSLIHWLIPKASLIIDSQAMEIRKIDDLKALNRLLVNISSTLDDASAREIFPIIAQGMLIPLSTLENSNRNEGFLVPKDLASVEPGAENLIYNAPRYYPLGNLLVRKCLQIAEASDSNPDLSTLQQEISSFCKLPSFVFYSIGGIDTAVESKKLLSLMHSDHDFLTGYLQLDFRGRIVAAHLLTPDHFSAFNEEEQQDDSEVASADTKRKIGSHDSAPALAIGSARSGIFTNFDPGIHPDAPLSLQLASLSTTRQQTLKPVIEEITTLLNKHAQGWQPDVEEKLASLQAKYFDIDAAQQDKIVKKFESIAATTLNTRLAAADFLNHVNKAGLTSFLEQYLTSIRLSPEVIEANRQKIDECISEIDSCTDLRQLQKSMLKVIPHATFAQIPDEELLLVCQNNIRSHLIQKLNLILLSPKHCIPSDAQIDEYRQLLAHILDISSINDTETYEFYLREFEESFFSSPLPVNCR